MEMNYGQLMQKKFLEDYYGNLFTKKVKDSEGLECLLTGQGTHDLTVYDIDGNPFIYSKLVADKFMGKRIVVDFDLNKYKESVKVYKRIDGATIGMSRVTGSKDYKGYSQVAFPPFRKGRDADEILLVYDHVVSMLVGIYKIESFFFNEKKIDFFYEGGDYYCKKL